MRNKNSMKLKIVAISCFLIAKNNRYSNERIYNWNSIFSNGNKLFTYFFLVKNKINLSLPNTYKT